LNHQKANPCRTWTAMRATPPHKSDLSLPRLPLWKSPSCSDSSVFYTARRQFLHEQCSGLSE
jgi:hypothetical protein